VIRSYFERGLAPRTRSTSFGSAWFIRSNRSSSRQTANQRQIFLYGGKSFGSGRPGQPARMPLTISRIGRSRGRPVAQGFGKCGAITRPSAAVRSVWYRVTVRLCCRRVVGVHMANPKSVQETSWNQGGRQ
jgi:hypothetical protein